MGIHFVCTRCQANTGVFLSSYTCVLSHMVSYNQSTDLPCDSSHFQMRQSPFECICSRNETCLPNSEFVYQRFLHNAMDSFLNLILLEEANISYCSPVFVLWVALKLVLRLCIVSFRFRSMAAENGTVNLLILGAFCFGRLYTLNFDVLRTIVTLEVGQSHGFYSVPNRETREQNLGVLTIGVIEVDIPQHPDELQRVVYRSSRKLSTTLSEFVRTSPAPVGFDL